MWRLVLARNIETQRPRRQLAQAAGAPVQVEVYEGMWHDWIQYTEGCRSRTVLKEGVAAIERVGRFFALRESSRVVVRQRPEAPPDPMNDNEWRSGIAAPVRWIFNNNDLPPASAEDCKKKPPTAT